MVLIVLGLRQASVLVATAPSVEPSEEGLQEDDEEQRHYGSCGRSPSWYWRLPQQPAGVSAVRTLEVLHELFCGGGRLVAVEGLGGGGNSGSRRGYTCVEVLELGGGTAGEMSARVRKLPYPRSSHVSAFVDRSVGCRTALKSPPSSTWDPSLAARWATSVQYRYTSLRAVMSPGRQYTPSTCMGVLFGVAIRQWQTYP